METQQRSPRFHCFFFAHYATIYGANESKKNATPSTEPGSRD